MRRNLPVKKFAKYQSNCKVLPVHLLDRFAVNSLRRFRLPTGNGEDNNSMTLSFLGKENL